MSERRIEITEHDDAGNITATYIQSGEDRSRRIGVIPPERSKSLWQQTLDIFLPAGYPNSVTHDYLECVQSNIETREYQTYDSLQAFTSSIASLLSSRAVLSSVGVGDSTASPTTALLYTILQESTGRLATIAFAHRLGTALEPECKMYRLLADVLNDIAFILDCLSPLVPSKTFRVGILSFSAALRALCGVAAGSAKASLSAHFALRGNLAELNAKDSSQETVISLLGMLVGSVVVSVVTGPWATWTTLLALLAVHLEMNRRAVRAVAMRCMNRQRAGLVFHALSRGRVPTPVEVAEAERVFERDGVLRDAQNQIMGHCVVGVGMEQLLRAVGGSTQSTSPDADVKKAVPPVVSGKLDRILELYSNQPYILWHANTSSRWPPTELVMVLKRGATSQDVLLAWWQALALMKGSKLDGPKRSQAPPPPSTRRRRTDEPTHGADWEAWESSIEFAEQMLQTHGDALKEKGWDLEASALETRASIRVQVGYV